MDTIDKLLSLVELRMQTRDVRVWQPQVPLFIQLLRSLSMEEVQLLSQHTLARYAPQDEDERGVLNRSEPFRWLLRVRFRRNSA